MKKVPKNWEKRFDANFRCLPGGIWDRKTDKPVQEKKIKSFIKRWLRRAYQQGVNDCRGVPE